LLDLGDAGDEAIGDRIDDLVSYHSDFVLEAVETTARKRLLFADRASNALLLVELIGTAMQRRISGYGDQFAELEMLGSTRRSPDSFEKRRTC